MRAAQVVRLDGPSGVEVVQVAEPVAAHGEYLVDVHAAGVSFPDLLLSQGRYQLKPDLPFTLGVDFAGVVRSGPADGALVAGDRVAGWRPLGAVAEVVASPAETLFPLPGALSFEQGASLPMNYLTAHFALRARGGLSAGDSVLVHGASGGVGTAAVQVAKLYAAHVVAVVSNQAKAEVARAAGADDVLLATGFLDGVRALTGGRGVDLILDVVGTSDLVLDSLRALAPEGRLLVVGFASGEIASVKLNRLLLNNIDVRGVSWGPYTRAHPGFARQQWDELLPALESGALTPLVGHVLDLADVGLALTDLAERRSTGKSVIRLR